ncbi:hypothetical protein A2442_00630 [Candidatus Campbellbacteria bacterium RIFOXYC2_FULL_35_25]|uniref:Uncharacterized protein n=1 Tax=Candidatus Campbellbacteria bacterium RIFOXYC2_FULL_35_25 TaxID=1797582 RepID=A0A1F5EIS5_9BACT|nr:MAG: hypothetical protein A2442_00630 [Candidatus Campbellbacteria bacterium RIFOXYC2_FULL_35_25]
MVFPRKSNLEEETMEKYPYNGHPIAVNTTVRNLLSKSVGKVQPHFGEYNPALRPEVTLVPVLWEGDGARLGICSVQVNNLEQMT